MPTLSIVVPAYNERRTLLSLLCRVLDTDLTTLDLRKEVLVVDDGSTDGTREIVEALGRDWRAVMAPALRRRGLDVDRALHDVVMRALLQPRNRGKGAALRAGFHAARGDYVLVQDADLEYDPGDYPRLLAPLLDGRADAVYGSRFLGEERRVLLFWHSVGNRVITLLSNAVNDLNLSDVETCYKVFRREVIQGLDLRSERFGFEVEVTAKLAKLRQRIYEVPIRYSGRGYEAGKKITWKDGVEAVWCIVRYGFSSDVLEQGADTETLGTMGRMRPTDEHLFRVLRPWLGRRILEAGSGRSQMTDRLLGCGEVLVTDPDPSALRRLDLAFGRYDNVRTFVWELGAPLPPEAGNAPVDTLVCIDVLETAPDEGAALAGARSVLEQSGGRLILLVPAGPALRGTLDVRRGYLRRYTRGSLRRVLEAAGFTVEHLSSFDLPEEPPLVAVARPRSRPAP